MGEAIYTLQDFLSYTKGVTYLMIVAVLISIGAFWGFLVGRDEDNE